MKRWFLRLRTRGCADLRRIAEEQSALRRVATAVARGMSPPMVFTKVASELGSLLKADYTAINRYEPDQTMSVVAYWNDPRVPDIVAPLGGRWPIDEDTAAAEVRRTGRPARRASESITSELGGWLRSHQIGHVVDCPVTVEGDLWGVTAVMFLGPRPPPADTEAHMFEFVELVGCTIAQAESRRQLLASRTRLVAASDETRRRIERNLHDGVQQHLVTLGLDLRAAQTKVRPEDQELRQQLSSTVEGLAEALSELQEISRGLHPAALARTGLAAALKSLADRSPLPGELSIQLNGQPTQQIQVTIYYIVSEALTNVAKHAKASMVRLDLTAEDERIRLHIRDDGIGGADLRRGSGLTGLNDRVEALGGTMRITSPPGAGTSLLVTVPASQHRE